MSEASLHEEVSVESLVARLADEFVARRRNGERPAVEEYAARHPEAADLVRKVLASLELIGLSQVGGRDPFETAAEPPRTLGDFRIVREVGKGGMGVVYEAEQVSLRRRVALKVLPLAAMMDGRQLQRFHNEARAAACLHHTNIVPVFSVGCECGVHFYAMQFIDGRPLSEVIRELSAREKKPTTAAGLGQTTAYQPPPDDAIAASPTPPPAAEATPLTGGGQRDPAYFRKVAQLGVQAAEALDHAHQLGIVHRDVKPGNLLLDGAGRLWVTDFGLAHMQQGEAGLTLTGQAVGTPRYMSPEQALARRAPVDHRTDVYSLGATLYELLTLRPAFAAEDRHELLRQIAVEEPAPPRRLHRAIPAELETIVLKAMAKNPAERYATAGDLADDLRRWLEDRPIRARRPSLRARVVRWGRRHKTLVVSAAAALVVGMAVLAGSAGWVMRDRAARQAKTASDLEAALEDAQRYRREGKLPRAQAAAKRAEALLPDSAADPVLAGRVRGLLRELAEEEADGRLVSLLGEMRLRQADVDVKGNRFLLTRARPDYEQAFRSYGLRWETMTPEEAAARLRSRPEPVRATLVAALDHWLILARHEKGPEADWLERVLSLADPDAFRQGLRAARARNDRQALIKLAAQVDPATQPPESLFLLDLALRQRGAPAAAVALLRRTQEVFPADFWVNHNLGVALQQCRPPQYEEAIRFLTVAAALRPESPGVRLNLGLALWRKDRLDEAAVAFRQAIDREADYALAYHHLGRVLYATGRLQEAVASFRRDVALRPDWAATHFFLGNALAGRGRPAEAAAAYRRAVGLKPDYAEAHCNLGNAFRQQGELVQALAAYERGHELGTRRPFWPYPSARWVRDTRRLVELEGRFPAILRGEAKPAGPAEQVEFARLCQAKGCYLTAARFWADAFAADPGLAADVKLGRREEAIGAAARAAAGAGADAGQLDGDGRARWRKQALQWLRDDLAAFTQLLRSGKPEDCRLVRQRLWSWQYEQELAGLREPGLLARLPADDQDECRRLWAAVESLRKKTNLAP